MAQESPTPSPSQDASPTPNVTLTPSEREPPTSSSVATPTPSPIPTRSAPTRNVRISFLPPPLEGTISLGIYDSSGKLARVLHQEAELDEFTVGADALMTKWDGKNDDGEDLPTGKYHARGFLVAPVKIEELGRTESPVFIGPPDFVRVKLIPNPLENNERPVINVGVGFDDENAYLKTTDGLPLLTIAQTGDIMGTDVALIQRADKSLDVFLRIGSTTREFHVTGVEKMMAFDCGEIELR